MADNDIIDFYKKADRDQTPEEPLKEQTETPEQVVSEAVSIPVPESNDPFDKFLYNLADKIKDSKPQPKPVVQEEEQKEESVPQDEPFNKFLLELAEKLQKEKVITKQQQETLAEEVDKPISTNPDEKDPFKKFIGSFANILKQDELVNREENIKEATIDFINKLKEQPDNKPFFIEDEPKSKKEEIEQPSEQEPELVKEEPVVEEQNDNVDVQQTEDNSYVKELKQGDKNNRTKKEDKSPQGIKSIVEKQVAEILSRYPNLGFTGGGGGTNAVQYAEGGVMNGDLTVNGTINANVYLSAGQPLSVGGGGGGGTSSIGITSVNNFTDKDITINNYIYTTVSQNVSGNRKYGFDTTAGTLTATLPSNPQIGDEIEFFDIYGTWFVNPFVVENNNRYIEQRDDNIFCNVRFGLFKLIYTGSAVGWRIVPLPKHDIPAFVLPFVSISSTIDLGYDPITVGFIGINNLDPALGPVDNWYWNLTGGSQPDFFTQAVTYTYSTPGVYTVTLTASNIVGINTATKTITALPVLVPEPVITANALVSAIPFNISLSGNNTLPVSSSPVVNWYWNLTGGNDIQFTAQNVTFTYDTSGIYVVTLSAENASGIGTTSITVTALQPLIPVPVISASAFAGNIPLTVTLSGFNTLPLDLSPVNNWYWNLTGGDQPDYFTQNVTYTYSTPGTYTVNLTASNMTGFGTTSVTITANVGGGSDPYINNVFLLVHFNT